MSPWWSPAPLWVLLWLVASAAENATDAEGEGKEGAATPGLNLFFWPQFTGEEFLEEHFEDGPFVVRQGTKAPLSAVFRLDELDGVIHAGLIAPVESPGRLDAGGDLLVVKVLEKADEEGVTRPWTAMPPPGMVTSVSAVHDAFGAGFSVVLNQLHRRWPSVHSLVGQLEAELGLRVAVNAYLTPPGAQAFEGHFDWMDGVVVQIAGRKSWTIYERLVSRPRPDQRYKPRREELMEPETFVMETGDVLYIPRGFPHEATTTDLKDTGPSLHLTFGLEAAVESTREIVLHSAIDAGTFDHEILGYDVAWEAARHLAPWVPADLIHAALAAAASAMTGSRASALRHAVLPPRGAENATEMTARLKRLAVGVTRKISTTEALEYFCSLPGANRTIEDEYALGPDAAHGLGREERRYLYLYVSGMDDTPLPALCAKEGLRTDTSSPFVHSVLESFGKAPFAEALPLHRHRVRQQRRWRQLEGDLVLESLAAAFKGGDNDMP